MKRSLRLCACVGVVLAVVLLTPAYTRAEFAVSGNTFLAATQLDATDNWVLCRLGDLSDGMVTAFMKGTDSPDFDSDPGLVVMYQLANNGGGNLDVKRLKQLTGNNKVVTSWGYFSGWGFKDGDNPVGLTENMGLDTWPPAANYRIGGTPGFTLVSGLVDPSTITLETGDFIEWGFANGLTHEQDVSSLLVFTTSTTSWDFKYEDISDINELELCSGLNGTGPEPATLGLLALGGLGALLRRRKSKV